MPAVSAYDRRLAEDRLIEDVFGQMFPSLSAPRGRASERPGGGRADGISPRDSLAADADHEPPPGHLRLIGGDDGAA